MAQVLIAVRDPDLRKFVRMLLRSQYDLVEAANDDDALRLMRTSASALVVLIGDWPPAVSGEGILRACEQEPELQRHVYCLVSTNYEGLAPGFRELVDRLAVPIVPVPSDLHELLRIVQEAHARADSGIGTRAAWSANWSRKAQTK
jgi:DNA-binding NtrC family response regulator